MSAPCSTMLAPPGNGTAEDYFCARDDFRRLTEQLGWEPVRLAIDDDQGASLDLTIDGAYWAARSRCTLIVSSGLHGVEGPFGSAVQRAWLRRLLHERTMPPVNVLLLHAVNPWGWLHGRRTDAFNRDLNRNFLQPEETYTGVPDLYRQLDWFINPPTPPRRLDFAPLVAAALVCRYGLRPLMQSIAQGQYELPRGLFYGGSGPAPQVTHMHAILQRFVRRDHHVMHLDLHTGLGKPGKLTLIVDHPIEASQACQLHHWFPDQTVVLAAQGPSSYQARGSWGSWCHRQQLCHDYVYLCVEAGTYSAPRVFFTMRNENRAHFWTPPDSSRRAEYRTKLRETFYPRSPTWRGRATGQGLQILDRALQVLSG
ncbi:MAG: hypothetical protein KatS3mg111_1731 [Pirellulaceae bacterium]|nr:MAG: hypothetical protein KatS3mg111_1731 [Pirellulaceae bacterium]